MTSINYHSFSFMHRNNNPKKLGSNLFITLIKLKILFKFSSPLVRLSLFCLVNLKNHGISSFKFPSRFFFSLCIAGKVFESLKFHLLISTRCRSEDNKSWFNWKSKREHMMGAREYLIAKKMWIKKNERKTESKEKFNV